MLCKTYQELTPDSDVKEVPKESEERHQADLVTNQYLSADSPPEERKVGWVSRVSIDARSDELVAVLLYPLRRVVEVGASRRHGEGTRELAKEYQEQTDGDRGRVDVALLVGWKVVV